MKMILNSIKFYLLWASIHYATTNLYQHLCAERSLLGFIVSSLNTQMPHCKAISWLQLVSIKTLDSYWVIIGSYLVGKLTGVLGGVC